jgi:hypothetical protein
VAGRHAQGRYLGPMRISLAVILVSLSLAAAPVSAETLSVVPLAKSLQNPALVDAKSPGFTEAFDQVAKQLLNQPEPGELAAVQARISALAAHRDSRVGKLFFSALGALPDIENLGDSDFAAVHATWPIALGGSISVRVEYHRSGESWLIAKLETTADGVAAAPLAGMAPYFGIGSPRPELLDLEAIDYLVGRDPADREKIESERAPFDFDAALVPLFESEPGAFESLLTTLDAAIRPGVDREKRIAAVKPHLADADAVKAMQEADDDDGRREAFWTAMREQVAGALKAPRPAAVPKAEGAKVRVRYRAAGSKDEQEQSATRLSTGKLALGG